MDMITRIRNGILVRSSYVKVSRTDLTYAIAKVLMQEGFIYLPVDNFKNTSDSSKPYFLVGLKYKSMKEKTYISSIVRVSTPGQRVYCKKKKVPRVLSGVGISVRLNE